MKHLDVALSVPTLSPSKRHLLLHYQSSKSGRNLHRSNAEMQQPETYPSFLSGTRLILYHCKAKRHLGGLSSNQTQHRVGWTGNNIYKQQGAVKLFVEEMETKHFLQAHSRTRRHRFWEAGLLDTRKKNHGEGDQTWSRCPERLWKLHSWRYTKTS